MLTIQFYNFKTFKMAYDLKEAEQICRKACFEAAVYDKDGNWIASFNPISSAFSATIN